MATYNAKIKTILTIEDIALIAAMAQDYKGKQKQHYIDLVNRLANEMSRYPDNDFTDGKVFAPLCTQCGSDKVRIFDNEALFHPDHFDKDKIMFDNEIYASWTCDNCDHMGRIEGKITWGELSTTREPD